MLYLKQMIKNDASKRLQALFIKAFCYFREFQKKNNFIIMILWISLIGFDRTGFIVQVND